MAKKNFYACKRGRAPGIYTNWPDCETQVKGYADAQHKGFATKAEAEAYMAGAASRGAGAGTGGGSRLGVSVPDSQPPKRQKVSGGAGSSGTSAAGVATHELAIFTDGACQGNTHVAERANPAGWGAAVVKGCAGLPPIGGTKAAELFGPVELVPSAPAFLGAEVGSNNTGELSAVCEALRWLTEHEPTAQPAVICYDSVYAANIAQGIFRAHKNVALAQRSHELLAGARRRRSVRFLHVKGHSGHEWNDEADRLANRGAAGERSAGAGWLAHGPAG